jgi:replicative superfamily II helicase
VHAQLRGIGVHHVQVKGAYRQSIEYMFRKKQLSVVFATSTLAQVWCGVVSCCCNP